MSDHSDWIAKGSQLSVGVNSSDHCSFSNAEPGKYTIGTGVGSFSIGTGQSSDSASSFITSCGQNSGEVLTIRPDQNNFSIASANDVMFGKPVEHNVENCVARTACMHFTGTRSGMGAALRKAGWRADVYAFDSATVCWRR